MKLIKDVEDDGKLETALDVLAKHDDSSYHTNISKDLSQEKAPETFKRPLHKMSFVNNSLPSILIGNIVTSVISKRL